MSRLLQAFCAMLIASLAPWSPAAAQTKPAPANIRVTYIPIANYTPLLVALDVGPETAPAAATIRSISSRGRS